MKKNLFNDQKGFTLIEIISVLVILGILAAVAIPKYIDLQDDAKNKAVQGALASGASQATMMYSKLLLSAGTAVPTSSVVANLTGSYLNQGDYVVSYSGGAAGVMTIEVTGPASLIPAGTGAVTSKILTIY